MAIIRFHSSIAPLCPIVPILYGVSPGEHFVQMLSPPFLKYTVHGLSCTTLSQRGKQRGKFGALPNIHQQCTFHVVNLLDGCPYFFSSYPLSTSMAALTMFDALRILLHRAPRIDRVQKNRHLVLVLQSLCYASARHA